MIEARTLDQQQEFLKNCTLLYVEDEEDARDQFSYFLSDSVGNLVVATNGKEGLEAYGSKHPRIIITDIQMPFMDGLSMVREIRENDRTIPVIVLTAFEEIDYLKRSINIGVDKFLTKPVDAIELQDALLECARRLMSEEALRSAAAFDSLTGLANRKETTKRFEVEKSRAERHDTPFSLIIADLDHFKKVNDTFGHIAGDLVLKSVCGVFTSLIRSEDTCGRWGGEEFLVILPETELGDAVTVAEKLRYAVSELVITWGSKNIAVTISMGVTGFKPGMNMHDCIESADKALYRAKSGGRNRVERACG